MNKMKKYFSLILILASVFLIGNKNVYAASPYWEKVFKNFGDINFQGTGLYDSRLYGIKEWKDYTITYSVNDVDGRGATNIYNFVTMYYSKGGIFNDISNLQITNNNDDILIAEASPYDFSREKKNYEDYIDFYSKLTLEEINSYQNENDKYEQKPTWWEYNGYQTEPTTWWEAYRLDSEPTNAMEVVPKVKDLGKASFTISADGKSDITINYTIQVSYFPSYWKELKVGNNKTQGLVEILNNLDKYKDVISSYGSGNKSYNFAYAVEENEDLSAVINALKGKDITVKFVQGGAISTTYYLNGKDIKSTVNKGFTFYHNISMETSINKDKINSLVDLKDALYIDFAYHGNLPAPYTMTVNIMDYIRSQYEKKNREQYQCGAEYDDCWQRAWESAEQQANEYMKNKKFTLLYYNPDTNKMEVINDGLTANANGELELTFNHFSSYVIVGSDDYKITNNPQTSNVNMIAYLLIAVASIAGISCLTISMKKRKND